MTFVNCPYMHKCSKVDCNSPICLRKFKLDVMYEKAMFTNKQRTAFPLYPDKDGTDLKEFERLANICNYILEFMEQQKSIFLHSPTCGNGKTSWALRVVQSYFNAVWGTADVTKCHALFINVPHFLISLKQNITTKSEEIEYIQKNIYDADIVIFDDIATKGFTDFEHEHILNIINTRLEKGLVNIYTSNLKGRELANSIGDRLYSRVTGNVIDIEFHGKDKRGI